MDKFYYLLLVITILYICLHWDIFVFKNQNTLNINLTHFEMLNKRFKRMYKTVLRNNNNNNNNNIIINESKLFKKPNTTDNNNNNIKEILMNIYDAYTGELLLTPNGEPYIYPNSKEIPSNCGFGKLMFNQITQSWKCSCHAPDYFGGEYCDELQDKLTIDNNCAKVGNINNLDNTDVSQFNPFLEGICVECISDNATPVIDSPIPRCEIINNKKKLKRKKWKNPCFYDAINPNSNSSSVNKYIPGYGCACDYYNGFVEVQLKNPKYPEDISHACIKLGKRNSLLHKSHLAYHTFKNLGKPIQIHEYNNLEQPFNSIFPGKKSLLVDQPSIDLVHEYDWLNRCIKPYPPNIIRRIKYPRTDWPIVHKRNLINIYESRLETYPISALRLATGQGFETKHWYETTNMRYLNNAVLGRPIMYGDKSAYNKIYKNKCIINPLGAQLGAYYGITMLHSPTTHLKLDIRGYEQEKVTESNVITIPPNYKEELMDIKQDIYVPHLFNSYKVKG